MSFAKLPEMDISELRREYTKDGLRRKDLKEDPFDQFGVWFEQACKAEVLEPNAMILATAGADGRPTQRTMLLKGFDHRGLIFFTNFESRKARQIAENPQVCLLFPWLDLERQLIVTGDATRISTSESLKYFLTRPLGSRLGAWASHQSRVISSRKILEMKLDEVKRRFKEGKVPLPSFWGGYRVKPRTFEFWQGGASRLHDRFLYSLQEDETWKIERLAP